MNKLIYHSIKNRKITIFLTIIVALAGIGCYYYLPKQESPDVSVPVAMIITPYPGASPNDVKELVTTKIEEKLLELENFDYSTGTSKNSVSVVIVYFDSNADFDKAMQDVRNAVEDVKEELPSGAMSSIINTDLVESAGIIISLSGEEYTYEQLNNFAKMYEEALENIDGISKVNIVGDQDKEIQIHVDIAKLNRLDLSMEDICKIIAAQNIQIPAGDIDYENQKMTVNINGQYQSIDDIKKTIISVSKENGVTLTLSDIADIEMVTAKGEEKFKQNGNNAVLITGYFENNKNVIITGKDVRKAIEKINKELPENLIIDEVIYQPDDVSKSTNDFMINLILGVILVVIVVFFGMNARNAIVVSTAMPISILMTFIVMYFMGIQVHQISLTALIIALGILVDNSIVVCDAIQVRLNNGEEKFEAIYSATKKNSLPIIVATFLIIVAFSPLLGIPGGPGQFMKPIPQVLIISIIASFISAMFIIPPLMMSIGKAEKNKKTKVTKIRKFFDKYLDLGLRFRKSTILVVIVLLIITLVVLLPMLPSQIFPTVDKDYFYIDIYSNKIADIDATEKLADEVEALLQEIPEVTSCVSAIGNGIPKFYVTMAPPMPLEDFAQILVKFDLEKTENFNNNEEFSNYIQSLLNEKISDGTCKVKMLEYAIPVEAKVLVRVSGEDLDRLIEVSNDLQQEITKIPGTTNVRDSWNDQVLQLEVDLDEDRLSHIGLTKYDVQKEINIALYGYDASIFRNSGKEYSINIDSNIDSAAMLENFMIKSSITGNKSLLKDFAEITYSYKTDTIKTYNKTQCVDILVDVIEGYDSSAIEDIIEYEILPNINTDKTQITFNGERENVNEYFSVLIVLALIAVFLMYIILVMQFKSFIQPLVILVTVPLSLIGSVIGLVCFGQPLSLTALLGIIALIGLVVKNGILLIEYTNEARNKGMGINEACIEAVDQRYNSIILSALTTILGLIPLAVSGSDLFAPMAISLMSGLMVSTFLTMVVIPVIYSLIEEISEKRNIKKQQKKNKKEVLKIKSIKNNNETIEKEIINKDKIINNEKEKNKQENTDKNIKNNKEKEDR